MEARMVTVRVAAGAGRAPSERDSPVLTTPSHGGSSCSSRHGVDKSSSSSSSSSSRAPRGGNADFLSGERGGAVVRPAEAASLVHTENK